MIVEKSESYPKVYLYRRIVQAKLFIDENYYRNIDLDNIAEEASFSKFHFSRLFKSIYGKTTHQYLIAVRIEKAKEFLMTSMSITDVCYSVGLESISSFTGLFKKITGETPAHFRIRKQIIKKEIAVAPLKFVPSCFAEKKGWSKFSNSEEAL